VLPKPSVCHVPSRIVANAACARDVIVAVKGIRWLKFLPRSGSLRPAVTELVIRPTQSSPSVRTIRRATGVQKSLEEWPEYVYDQVLFVESVTELTSLDAS